ncbi:MAG: AmmeMemoRadiSam system protein A [Planctomycetota bacterium]
MALTPDERRDLLKLARAAMRHAVAGDEFPQLMLYDGVLGMPRGCFVTLTRQGQLRGCIGTFSPRGPLAEMVAQMAVQACRDPRFQFDPITPGELAHLDVEISVLSPLEPIDDPMSIQIGTHGIYITQGARSGCFLPEVATDQGWGVEDFLTQCCAGKAGLAPDAWKHPDTKVMVFSSEKFGD